MDQTLFFRRDHYRNSDIYTRRDNTGQWMVIERPRVFRDHRATIQKVQVVISTGTSLQQAMERVVMMVAPTKKGTARMAWEFPSQRIDSHVYCIPPRTSNAQPYYEPSYPVGALLGRDLEILHIPVILALRRYFFHDQQLPAWLIRLVAQPTHVMITNGVYVRILWVSVSQMEELFIYAHSCYKAKNCYLSKQGKSLAMTDHPQCHLLADLCCGQSYSYIKQAEDIQDGNAKNVHQLLRLRNLDHQVSLALSRIAPEFDPSGAKDFWHISRDILVTKETVMNDEALNYVSVQHHTMAPPTHAVTAQLAGDNILYTGTAQHQDATAAFAETRVNSPESPSSPGIRPDESMGGEVDDSTTEGNVVGMVIPSPPSYHSAHDGLSSAISLQSARCDLPTPRIVTAEIVTAEGDFVTRDLQPIRGQPAGQEVHGQEVQGREVQEQGLGQDVAQPVEGDNLASLATADKENPSGLELTASDEHVESIFRFFCKKENIVNTSSSVGSVPP